MNKLQYREIVAPPGAFEHNNNTTTGILLMLLMLLFFCCCLFVWCCVCLRVDIINSKDHVEWQIIIV